MTKLLIAGGRTFNNYNILLENINKLNLAISTIISGGAVGADSLAIKYAQENNISLILFLPDYDKYKNNPKFAPLARNILMAKYCDYGLIFWDNHSRGTAHMINQLTKENKQKLIINYNI